MYGNKHASPTEAGATVDNDGCTLGCQSHGFCHLQEAGGGLRGAKVGPRGVVVVCDSSEEAIARHHQLAFGESFMLAVCVRCFDCVQTREKVKERGIGI